MKIKDFIFSIKEKSLGSKEYTEIKILGVKLKKRNKSKESKKKIERLKYLTYKYIEKEKQEEALCDFYFDETGEFLDLRNPINFNQKIQWLKMFDNNDTKKILSDKFLAREWIKNKIGENYLIPLLGYWEKFEEINFEQLPRSFVLKCNHGSGYNILVKDKYTFDREEASKKITKWLNENYAYVKPFEFQYKDIDKKIIAEKYLDENKPYISDYKLWCFDGKVHYIQYIIGRNKKQRMAFYNREWVKQDFVSNNKIIKNNVTKPKKLDKLIELAEILSEGFKFVRVDFYITQTDEIKFGEMTFSPASGIFNWMPKEQNKIMGELLNLGI